MENNKNTAKQIIVDGNYAASYIAYALSEIAAIYPITPSSPMGENADAWASKDKKNLWGQNLDVIEMQSEGGAAGTVHGSLCSGSLTTTFTASQGLLLMLPDMHKIAGEMLPCVFHVASRSLASHSLSIFGDHSDVMSARNTGFAILSSAGVQEVMDLALVAHLATLRSEIPFMHFFDGFRSSHEVSNIWEIPYEQINQLMDEYREDLSRFRQRSLRPENAQIRIASQNPDVFFQAKERSNPYYQNCPAAVQQAMDELAQVTGRSYKLFDYVGHPEARDVIIAMGSACDTIEQTVAHLNQKGQKTGAIKVRLYRPFSAEAFISQVPTTVENIAVLDRCKEAGSLGEPLYQDILSALHSQKRKVDHVIGGRYGLSSKEFTSNHCLAIFKHLAEKGFHGFTVGINDDVQQRSLAELPANERIDLSPEGTVSCLFWGLGSDGTVGANKNSVKIIGEQTPNNVQAYFVYDSRKAFGLTVSHLRFGPGQLRMPYQITSANFVASHHPSYPQRYHLLEPLLNGGTFLLNTPLEAQAAFASLREADQQILKDRQISFYVIDASAIALRLGIKGRINTIMQAAFFHLSGVVPPDEALELIKDSIAKTYSSKGQEIVESNWQAVDAAIAGLKKVDYQNLAIGQDLGLPETQYNQACENALERSKSAFVKDVLKPILAFQGDGIPVSKLNYDGTMPQGTARLEKRRMAIEVPRWLPENCIQCNLCVMTCPHSVIRAKQIPPQNLENKPSSFETIRSNTVNGRDLEFRIQIYTDDCTGCGVCIDVCPAKVKALEYSPIQEEIQRGEVDNYQFFDRMPDNILDGSKLSTPKGIGFTKPYFEFHSACAGCGETPYYNLVTKLYGPRMIVANATGCSSIYGGAFPSTPFVKDKQGRGVAWANSLFEDNAEYALGMRLSVDGKRRRLAELSSSALEAKFLPAELESLLKETLDYFEDTSDEAFSRQQSIKEALAKLKSSLSGKELRIASELYDLADYFVDKSVWAIGGDGWAYDIGFGGLDHVLSLQHNVNFLVLDTEVYSNTGGQSSKATPLGAIAGFAQQGRKDNKKDLGLMMMQYGHVYVAAVSMGANRAQVIKAFMEAEAYPGPSLILAYSPCIAHGIDMMKMQVQEKLAVETGYFPLYRYHPENPKGHRFTWDSHSSKRELIEFLQNERRYSNLLKSRPEAAQQMIEQSKRMISERYQTLKELSKVL